MRVGTEKSKEITISPDTMKKLREVGRRIKSRLDKLEVPSNVPASSQDIEITSTWDKEEITRLKISKSLLFLILALSDNVYYVNFQRI